MNVKKKTPAQNTGEVGAHSLGISKYDCSKYYSRNSMAASVSTTSHNSSRGLARVGDQPKFASMSMHKVFVHESILEQANEHPGRPRTSEGSMKLKFLIPCLPSYLVSPFPH